MTHLRKAGLGQRLVLYADAFDVAFLHCHRDLNKADAKSGQTSGLKFAFLSMDPSGS